MSGRHLSHQDQMRYCAYGLPTLPLVALATAAGGALARPTPPAAQALVPTTARCIAYRGPVIVLAYPEPGGTVPSDRPVVVFRFAPGQAADPIDVASLAVTVDGEDRSALFQVALNEAWGPLVARGSRLQSGAHEIRARICSVRGVCGSTVVAVTVLGARDAAGGPRRPSRAQRLIDLLLVALRKLLA